MGRADHSPTIAHSNPADLLPVVEDDQGIASHLLTALESTGLTPVHFESGEAFLTSETAQRAFCAVSNIQLPGMSGIEIVKQSRGRNPGCKFVLVSQSPRIDLVVDAMRSGAVTVLEVPCTAESLCSAVAEARALANSDPIVANDVLEHRKRLATLSTGERQVLAKLVEGVPHKKIATDLDVGLRTVELRKSRVMDKVGANTVAELIRIATVVRLFDSTTSHADEYRSLAGAR